MFISTCSVFARPVPQLPVTESSPRRQPVFGYARDKIACEEFLTDAYRAGGLPLTIVRPFHTYDATVVPVLAGWTAIERMRAGRPVIVHGDGTSLWTLMHASDFARALVPLLGNGHAIGESVNVVSGDILTWDQIHLTLAAAAGVATPVLAHRSSESIAVEWPSWAEVLEHDFRHSMLFDTGEAGPAGAGIRAAGVVRGRGARDHRVLRRRPGPQAGQRGPRRRLRPAAGTMTAHKSTTLGWRQVPGTDLRSDIACSAGPNQATGAAVVRQSRNLPRRHRPRRTGLREGSGDTPTEHERPEVMDNAREVVAMIRSDYPEPLWIQAATLIHDQINEGVLKAGARLPPERELCQQLGISRVTLRKALNQLVGAGVLNASHGRGWYVAKSASRREWPSTLESFSETAARMGLEPQSEVLRAEAAPASFDEAEELSIAPGTDLFHLDRVRLLDGMPIALDSTQIPLAVLPEIGKADFTRDSLYTHAVRRRASSRCGPTPRWRPARPTPTRPGTCASRWASRCWSCTSSRWTRPSGRCSARRSSTRGSATACARRSRARSRWAGADERTGGLAGLLLAWSLTGLPWKLRRRRETERSWSGSD